MMDYHYDWPSPDSAEELRLKRKQTSEEVLRLADEIMEVKLKTHGGRLASKRLHTFVQSQVTAMLGTYFIEMGDPFSILVHTQKYQLGDREVFLDDSYSHSLVDRILAVNYGHVSA